MKLRKLKLRWKNRECSKCGIKIDVSQPAYGSYIKNGEKKNGHYRCFYCFWCACLLVARFEGIEMINETKEEKAYIDYFSPKMWKERGFID